MGRLLGMATRMGSFHEITVARREWLTPGMVRLSFTGEDLSGFRSTGIGDEYVRLFFPDPVTGERVLPEIDAEGRWTFPAEPERVRYSTYTVRHFDVEARELHIDFVVHEGGMASEWAIAAQPGMSVVINSPRGLYAPPNGLSWQVLLADATGLPAVGRLLAQTPAHVASHIVVELGSEAHAQSLPYHPLAEVTWIFGRGNGVAPSALDHALPSIPLGAGVGYLWAGAEQKAARRIRNLARRMPAFGEGRQKVVAYWSA
ncbi:MAG: NADPH-dependent ferric siderophore reductase [Xanthobacteraceae bacterium]|nr:NADPH-dependent ferric siderophore reductase [Xanthobacteraceae bacterium]